MHSFPRRPAPLPVACGSVPATVGAVLGRTGAGSYPILWALQGKFWGAPETMSLCDCSGYGILLCSHRDTQKGTV